MKTFEIAILPGDGIGKEIMEGCLALLKKVQQKFHGYSLRYRKYEAGAEFFCKSGLDITEKDLARVGEADAILLGAMGLPKVRFEDGTEIAPHLSIRERYSLFAGVRPVRAFPNTPVPLVDPRGSQVAFVVLR